MNNSDRSGDSGRYHSLPHPQEHAQHYGGGGPTKSTRKMMMATGYQTESQRLFSQSVMSDVQSYGNDQQSSNYSSSYGGSSSGKQSFRNSANNTTRSGGFMMSSRSGFAQSAISEGDEYEEDDGGDPFGGGDEYYDDDPFGGGGGESQYDDPFGGGESQYQGGQSSFNQGGGPKYRNPIDNSNRSGMSGYSDEDRNQQSQYYNGQSEANLGRVEENSSEYYSNDPSSQQSSRQGGQGQQQQQPHIDRRGIMARMKSGSFRQQESNRSFQPSTQPSSQNTSARNSFNTQSQPSSRGSSGYQQQSMNSFTSVEEVEENLPVSPLRQLLDALNMSILPTSLRLSSLAQAVEFFDHRERSMHDAELREGGAFVLYHKLGLVLQLSKSGMAQMTEGEGGVMDKDAKAKNNGMGATMNHYLSYQQSLANSLMVQQQSEFDKEIAMICSCLEMVHRANPDAIAATWDECGIEILPLLVTVLERPFQKIERAVWLAIQEKANVPGSLERAVATAVTRDQKLAVQKVTKVLAMYSLVPEAKQPMCDCPGMLRWLTRIVDTHNYNRVKPGAPAIGGRASGVNSLNTGDGLDAKQVQRLEMATKATSGAGLYMTEAARFNTIATLTNLAAHEANRMPMLREPGLLDNICRAVHNERSDVPKQCAALAVMNMSNGDMDNVPEMARNDLVLETLLKLMKEDNPETRRNAVVTLFNVACSDQNTVRLARYRDGTILEALVDLVGSDDPILRGHDEARANAAETIFNMSCSEISETTDRMANHAGLLECLAVTLKGEHTGLEVKMYCSATLRRMSEIIRAPMIAQGALLSALVKASTWTNTDCVAEAFRAQAAVPENCVIMANHHGLLNALSRLALTRGEGEDVEKVRRASCMAIELMSRQDEARALLSQNEGIIMALTKASYGEEDQDPRNTYNGEGFLDGSERAGSRFSGDGEDDDGSNQSPRRYDVALKNLIQAM